jgi:hypothetical protein
MRGSVRNQVRPVLTIKQRQFGSANLPEFVFDSIGKTSRTFARANHQVPPESSARPSDR